MKTYKSPMPEISLKYKTGQFKKVQILCSQDLFEVFKEMYDQDTIEYSESMIVIYLNNANNTIGWTRHTSGGTVHTVVDPKMILTEALLCGAAGIAVSHNHPSGNLKASEPDKKVNEKVKKDCEALDIRFLDHIIVAGDKSGYYSFCDDGQL